MPSDRLMSTGETIMLNEPSPPGSICKDISRSDNVYEEEVKWYVKLWRNDKLMILIIIGVIIGFSIGLSINSTVQKLEEPTKANVLIILGFLGELFMRMLKMLILPLIVSSLIIGLADLDQKASGKLGGRAVLYYMGTTIIAVVLGIALVASIRPGYGVVDNTIKKNVKEVRTIDSFLDLIRNMFPDNIVKAAFNQYKTDVAFVNVDIKNVTVDPTIPGNETALLRKEHVFHTVSLNGTNQTYYQTWRTVRTAGDGHYVSGTNILGLVTFSIAVGIILGKLGHRARVFTSWMRTLNDIVMQLVTLVMWYSPVGICSLIAVKFAQMDDIGSTFTKLGMYMVTIIAGLAIHSIVMLPSVYFAVTKKNPLSYANGILKALVTAFGTSSSSATLPVTFRCLEENNKVDKRVTRFVLPVGATINMDGTALYEAVAAIFIAQSTGLELSFGQYIAVSLTATIASIGAAGIPQAGIVTMMIVLQTLDLPPDSYSLVLAVDWFLDRIRTTVNVLGDAYGAGVVEHLSRKDLEQLDLEHAHDNVEANIPRDDSSPQYNSVADI